jgi:hypothetical protein
MKRKSKITHAQLLAEGVVWLPKDEPAKPVKPTALDVVARPTPTNVAPKPTDPPVRKVPQATGLMRAINANIEAQGGTPIATRSKEKAEVTGLQRAILANIQQSKSKPKTTDE